MLRRLTLVWCAALGVVIASAAIATGAYAKARSHPATAPAGVEASHLTASGRAAGTAGEDDRAAASGPLGWTQVQTTDSPAARADASIAYDPAIGEVVLFGGYDQDTGPPSYEPTGFEGDTWTFNGTTWTKLSPANSPTARAGATMDYDPTLGELILVGGQDANGFQNDTWAFNGTDWTQLNTPTSPVPLWGSTMAYDTAAGELVLFGGNGLGTLYNGTDTFNGTTWDQVNTPTSPAARHYATMAYDAKLGQVVLFGGADGSQYFGDTWTFDGTDWTQLHPVASPSARYDGAMAYDSATGNIVHFGGENNTTSLSDTWLFTGTNWAKASLVTSPPGRGGEAMADDPANGTVVLFGGIGGQGYLGDTWIWNGITVPGVPSGLVAASGDGKVSLTWSAPVSDGGSAISGYDVFVSTSPGGENLAGPVNSQPVSGTSYVITGLKNGAGYYFVVEAVNAAGVSGPSGEAHATPITVAGAPSGLVAASGNGKVSLTWSAPVSDGGSAISGYDVFVSTSPGGENLAGPVNSQPVSGTSYVVTGLRNGVEYYFMVEAVNAAGVSGPSGEAHATPVTIPGVPSGLAAASGNGQVSLTWSAPVSDGGSAISGYDVFVSTSPGGENLAGPVNSQPVSGTSYAVTGLRNGVEYYFMVEAVNAAGVSSPSSEAHATPLRTPTTLRVWDVRSSGHRLVWRPGPGMTGWPKARLSFKTNRRSTLWLLLKARKHRRWATVATCLVQSHTGDNSLRIAGRWHDQLLPTRHVRLVVRIRRKHRWQTVKIIALAVRDLRHH